MRILPRFNLFKRTYVIGVLNVTPDSFSDGGQFLNKGSALRQALSLAKDGADIIDVGGESTRPGAGDISVRDELSRVIPVIRAIAGRLDIPISVDTRKAEVAEEAIKAGAGIVNDTSGLKYDKRMAEVVAKAKAFIIIMHMRGEPKSMQANPRYNDVVKDIISDLKVSMGLAKTAGVAGDKIIIDPGIGFGKTLEHNLEILNRLEEFKKLKLPICIGTSRKSFIGRVLGVKNPDERLAGTIATCAMSIMKGANLIRVHDVKEAVQAARMIDRILAQGAI